MLVTHGSPESIEEHIYHDTPVDRLDVLASKGGADLVIVGHSHEQFLKETEVRTLIEQSASLSPRPSSTATPPATVR